MDKKKKKQQKYIFINLNEPTEEAKENFKRELVKLLLTKKLDQE
jgi:hypothetical protein